MLVSPDDPILAKGIFTTWSFFNWAKTNGGLVVSGIILAVIPPEAVTTNWLAYIVVFVSWLPIFNIEAEYSAKRTPDEEIW